MTSVAESFTMSGRSAAVRLSLFYAAIFSVAGVLMPWWPVWLKSQGLSAPEIGYVLAVGFWIKPFANPLATRWADGIGERRRPLVILLLATALAYALFALGGGFSTFLVFAALANAAFSPVMPLGDNLTMTASAMRNLDYGRMRLWGSVTFIAAVYGAGWLLEGRDADVILWLVVGGFVLSGVVAAGLPDIRFPKPAFDRPRPLRLLRHPTFALFLVATGLNTAAHAVLYGFATIDWRAAGLSDVEIGWLWAEGVIAEIILFAVSRRIIGRTGPVPLLLVGCLAGIVRWSALAVADSFTILALLQVLHGLTFGAVHLGAMHFIQRAAPEGLSASAQGLFAAFGMGLFMGFGTLAAGELYGVLASEAFFAMAGLSAGASLAAAFLWRRFDGARLRL